MWLFSNNTDNTVTFKSPEKAKESAEFWSVDYHTAEEERIHQEQEQQRIKERNSSVNGVIRDYIQNNEVYSEDLSLIHI